MITHSLNIIVKSKIPTNGTVRYPPPRPLATQIQDTEVEPICVSTAIKPLECRKAMNTEFDALLRNGT